MPVESAVTVHFGDQSGAALESRAQRPDCPNRSEDGRRGLVDGSGESDLGLHRLAAIVGDPERELGVVQGDGVGDHGLYVDEPGPHQLHRGSKLLVEAERAA